MNSYIEVSTKYIEDSMRNSGGQPECWVNIRRFIIDNLGKNSLLILATDLLHHPKRSYRERVFEKNKDCLVRLDIIEMWEAAEQANLINDLHKEKEGVFIPKSYFFDLKLFFLDLMLLKFFLEDSQKILKSGIKKGSHTTLKKNGFSLMISKETGHFLVNLERGDRNFYEDLRRGLHLPIKEMDDLISVQFVKFGIQQ